MTAIRSRRVLVLALILATASGVLAYQLVTSRLNPAPAIVEVAAESGEPVLIGARSIPEGATLTASDVKIVYLDAAAKGERALTASSQAMGKVALVDIPEGEQIVAGSVGEPTGRVRDTFAQEVPVGMRAVTISTEETVGVGGFVQPGDRVDVIAGFELKPATSGDGTPEPAGRNIQAEEEFSVAELILQDVEVLAIGQAMVATTENAPPPAADPAAADQATAGDQAPAEGEVAGPVTRPEATTVTLLVAPAQALRLLLAVQAEGTFRLLLRAPGDASITQLPPALIVDGAVEMAPFELVGSNLPGGGLVITSSRFEHSSVPGGGILEFEVTVQNVSPYLIPAGGGGATVGHVYVGDDSWETIAGSGRPGIFSLGITSDTVGQQTFPWRWDIGKDLAPGESTLVTGGIQAPNQPGAHRWWFGVMIQPGTVVEDGVGLTEITVEPVAAIVVIASEVDLREAPWPDAPIVQTDVRGTTADVLEYRDGWFLIRSSERDGWVPEELVINSALPAAASIAAESAQAGEEESQ